MKSKYYQTPIGLIYLTLMVALCQLGANAVITGYLKIGDIPGESQRAGHEDEIEVSGLQWKVSRPDADSGRTRANATVTPLKVTKRIDKSSPYLALATLQGRVLPEIQLAVTKRTDDGGSFKYLVLTLSNVVVTSYEVITPDGSDVPTEEVGFAFETINYKYVEEADDHSAGDEHEIEYDIVAGA